MSRIVEQTVSEPGSMQTGVLVGRSQHALDPKKRLTIPSEWRLAMGNPKYVYVMPDRKERCLNLLSPAEMERRFEKLRDKALFDPALSRALQIIGANSEQLVLDVQGRIRICDRLLQFANLTTTVAMLASFRMIKLWDPAAAPADEKFEQASFDQAMDLLGF